MKKSIALLLGLMLVLGFALVACGEAATTDDGTDDSMDTTTTAMEEVTTTEEAASMAVDWTEAADYEESEATITGTVAAVDNLWEIKQIPKLLIRLGGTSEEDHFNIVIVLNADGTFPAAAAAYEPMLGALVGQTVEATGTVTINSFESVYEIIMNSSDDPETFTGTMELAM